MKIYKYIYDNNNKRKKKRRKTNEFVFFLQNIFEDFFTKINEELHGLKL